MTLQSLPRLSGAEFKYSENGKTTTKELINNILQQRYETIATDGNLNNHIGVPLTLLRMTFDIVCINYNKMIFLEIINFKIISCFSKILTS